MVFDSTISGENANSLASVAQADAHHNLAITSEEWAAVLPENKERNLAEATRLLQRYEFCGYVSETNQSLPFPRKSIADKEGRSLASDAIPKDILAIVCDLALFVEKKRSSTASTEIPKGIDKIKIGPIEVDFDEVVARGGQTSDSALVAPSDIKELLKHYLVSGGGHRLLRG